MPAFLELNSVSKSFGGLRALREVSLSLSRGEFVGLIGPNGAGKTTLFNVVSGTYKPDGGKIIFDGNDITGLRSHRIARLGIKRTFQLVRPFRNMTALENVMVSYVFSNPESKNPNQSQGEIGDVRTKCGKYMQIVGLTGRENTRAGRLTIGQLRGLEIARALAGAPKILLSDEVLAGLNETEVEEKLKLLEQLNHDGLTILMIEHNMRAIMRVCKKIYVLEEGGIIAQGEPKEVAKNPDVIRAYMGSETPWVRS